MPYACEVNCHAETPVILTLHFCESQAWNQPVKVGGSNPCFTTRIGVSRSRPAGWDFRYSCAVSTASCFSLSLAPLPIHRYTWQNIFAVWFLVVWKGYAQLWRENHANIHLIPDVQQHHIVLIQVILVIVCNLCRYKTTRLVGALKQPGRDTAALILKSEKRRNV